MELNALTRPKGLERKRRVGRGGKRGKTSGRGGKGQTARAGNKRRPEWRDIIKKIPKRRGYGKNRSRTAVPRIPNATVSISVIEKNFKSGETVSKRALFKKRLVRKVGGLLPKVKILGVGAMSGKLVFEGMTFSDTAKDAVLKAGGTIK